MKKTSIKSINIKKFIPLLAIIGILLVCGTLLIINKKNNELEKVFMHASWAYRYADVEDLTKNSDCIAIIKVMDNGSSYRKDIVPDTIFSAKVTRAIYNCEKDDKLEIYMTGGIRDSKIFELRDDPLMKKGEEYLIFAKKNEDGTVTTLTGTQGRMHYKNGKISSLNVVNHQVKESSGSTIMIDNVSEDAFIKEIKEYIANK